MQNHHDASQTNSQNPQQNPYQNPWLRKTYVLTQALIISGTLNIGLIATFIYFSFKDTEKTLTIEHKPSQLSRSDAPPRPSNEHMLRSYCHLSFEELILRLENKDLMEEGYTKRDLALASLVAFHHFNLERALGGFVGGQSGLQRRQIAFSSQDGEEKGMLTVFPGLADYQYQAIIHYAKTEKWPLTNEGLFFELKRSTFPRDPSLLAAFYLTAEYHTVFTLFLKSGVNINKEVLVEMLIEGEWNTLSAFAKQQRLSLDLNEGRRQALLVDYLHARSKMAAKILLETEKEFSLKRLGDVQLIILLELVENSTLMEGFAKELLTSPRSDLVRKKAATILYQLAKEPLPDTYDHQAVLLRFVPEAAAPPPPAAAKPQPAPEQLAGKEKPIQQIAKETPKKNTPKTKRTHTIQEGESLWKIAKKYQVSVEAIKRHNRLDSEKLRVGKTLDIPDK